MPTIRENGNLTKKGKITPSLIKTPEKMSNVKANEYPSASMELLTEFLFSIMTKNYEKALNYCTQILDYEPHNSTVQQFYPLILEKLNMKKLESSSSESSESDSSSESSESSDSSLSSTESDSQESWKSYKNSKDKTIEEINAQTSK